MSTDRFLDPFAYEARQWRAKIEDRLANIEARPRVVTPVPLVPRAVQGFPSTDLYMPITVGTFLAVWEMIAVRWTNQAVYVVVPWRTPSGTSGEVRLDASHGTTSNPVTLPTGSSGTVTFRWLHGAPIWTDGVLWVVGRRTAGSGTVELGQPTVTLLDPEGATTGGI